MDLHEIQANIPESEPEFASGPERSAPDISEPEPGRMGAGAKSVEEVSDTEPEK